MDAAEMTVEQFAQYLKKRRAELFDLTPQVRGKNNRSYIPHKKGQMFQSSGVKLAMQRRKAAYKNTRKGV